MYKENPKREKLPIHRAFYCYVKTVEAKGDGKDKLLVLISVANSVGGP